jgi:hypothetical protein
VKELGGLMLMLCVMLWLAARDPARNVAILDGFAAGLRVLAVTPLLAIKMLGLSKLHPPYMSWGRSGRSLERSRWR